MQLKLDRVTKQYKNKIAVEDMSIQLQTGVYGLLGANGAGKTTLMRMICGILRPDRGSIELDGIKVQEEAYRDQLGYLPQDFGYYPEFKAKDFMMYLAALKGIKRSRAKLKTAELLELVSLDKEANKKIGTFSGGMKQRLGIAQALINEPSVIILDEPTAGLDPKERVKFRNLIAHLGSQHIVLLSTHIVSDIEYIADQVLMMKDGKLIHQGKPQEIIKNIENKVWECKIAPAKAKQLMAEKSVVNLREEQGETFLRIISDEKPVEEARLSEATLEDLYLYYFAEEEAQ